MGNKQRNNKNLINIIGYSIAMVSTLTVTLEARNGFLPHYVGTHGLTGGAGMAYPQDASGVITNPSILTRLPSHLLLMAGVLHQDQYQDSSAAIVGNKIGRRKNKYDNVHIGTLGLNYRINPKVAVGLGVSGGGGFVKFKDSITNPNMLIPPNSGYNTEATNNIMLFSPAVSYAVSPNQTYGIGLLLGYSGFKTNLAKSDRTQTQGMLRKSTSIGAGARIGGLWNLNQYLSLGASVSTPVYFQQHKKYRDIFVSAMQIPATALIGVAWHVNPKTDIVFDVKEILYKECRWLTDGQGWRNQTVFLTGIQHKFTEKLTMGIGYNYGRPPIRNDKVLVNSLSIPLDEHNISGGVRYKFTPKLEFVSVVFFTPKKKMTDNGGGGGGGGAGLPPQLGKGTTLESRAYGLELGIKYNF